ncbi:MAG TPA: ACT domain-containing protein [Acidimicrobiales bacterium]|nr:ACT domain-containing protein [Acidimicrobiales bacterium]
MSHVAVTAVGSDRPGIVAAVTGVFVEHRCNIEDSSMTILRGQFAMMLVVDAPPDVSAAQLEAALGGPAADLELVVTVRPLPAADEEAAAEETGDDRWTVSVYGADRPGIVHGVASLLADQGVNIADLSTRVIGSAEQPVYAMVLEVALPAGVDPNSLADRLADVAAGLGVEASLHPSDADIL